MSESREHTVRHPKILVMGIGGGGGNTIDHLFDNYISDQYMTGEKKNITCVDLICANTDAQALECSHAKIKIHLGEEITRGLGAGADPNIGRQAAEESREQIRESLRGAHMIFITAGMGGGTGTGAAPVVAAAAKEMGLLTVAIVTRPFRFEGSKRMAVADAGIAELEQIVDSLIIIPNNKLLTQLEKGTTLLNAFKAANNVLSSAVHGIADLITRPGLINVDFADVRTVMSEMGMAMMGTGSASGENRAHQAAQAAISSPLLEDIDFSGARGVLVNITGGLDMSIEEFETVGQAIEGLASDNATVVVGTVLDPSMTDHLRVTVVVTGLGSDHIRRGRSEDMMHNKNNTMRRNVLRQQDFGETSAKAPTRQNKSNLSEYLDIPAFLRRNPEE